LEQSVQNGDELFSKIFIGRNFLHYNRGSRAGSAEFKIMPW
jgi:hypothetical protein